MYLPLDINLLSRRLRVWSRRSLITIYSKVRSRTILSPSGIITRWNYSNSTSIRLLPNLIDRNGQLSRRFRIPVTSGLTARLVDYR